jgi:hypothetical protein
MPSVGFEPTIAVFKRAKTVHALEGAATVIGIANGYVKETEKFLLKCQLHLQAVYRVTTTEARP